MGIQVANLAGMFQQGQQASQDDRKRSALAKFLQPARAGDAAAQTALYGAGAHTEAAGAQDHAQGQQKDAREEFGKASVMLTQLGNTPQAQQAYSQWRQHGIAAGVLPQDVGEQFDPGSLQVANAAAQAYGGMSGKTNEPRIVAPGSALVGNDGKLIYERPFAPVKPDYQMYDSADGPVWLPKPTGAPQSAPVSAGPSGGAPGPSGASNLMGSTFDDAVSRVLKTEGGYVANDAGKGPTNFGINSAANPDVNVQSLTADGAKEIYKRRYWDAINADQLPPAIRMAAFDAAVNMGPQKAMELVRASGGDPQKFAALRQQKYDGLVAGNPQKFGQYAEGWRNRNQESAGITAIPIAGVRPKAKPQMLTDAEVAQEGLPKGTKAYRDADGIVKTTYTPPASQQAGGKALPSPVVTKLTTQAGIVDNLRSLRSSFKPDFAGNVLGGSLENVVGQIGGERVGLATKGQSDWWQQYDRQKNQVRNELFGSALTPSEQAAFEAADVRPNMDPERILANLKMQDEIASKGLARVGKVWKAQGYNTEAIEAAIMPTDGAAAPKPGHVEGGYRFKGGDPANPNSWEKT